jgi:uncharacterized protein HemX
LERLLLELRSRLSRERSDWMLAEVEYLIRIAGHRLLLEKDPHTAITALNQAVQKLTLLSSPALQGVIEQLNRDISELRAISLPDKTRITADLAALSTEIPQWPFSDTGSAPLPSDESVPEQEQAKERGLSRTFSKIWADIKGLVTIRRSDEISRPLMDTEQRYFLQQNLRLKLEAARLALLGGHNQPYHDSLEEAVSWLQQYYDASSPLVTDAMARIQKLAVIDLEPPLPSLEQSLLLLQEAAIEIQAQAPAPQAPEITEEMPTDADAAPAQPLTVEPPATAGEGEIPDTHTPLPGKTPLMVPPEASPFLQPPAPNLSTTETPATEEEGEAAGTEPPPPSETPLMDQQAPSLPPMSPSPPPSEETTTPQTPEPAPAPQIQPPADVPEGITPPSQGIRL